MEWNEEMSHDEEESKIGHKDSEFTLYKLLGVESTATEQEISKTPSFLREGLLTYFTAGPSRQEPR
jgi:hypothetical protein